MQHLINAVESQLGSDSEAEFLETLKDVASHGADAGFSGFIYHTETREFAKRNMTEIMNFAKDQAADFGQDPLEMIAGFNCLNGEYPKFEIASVIYGNPDEATVNDGADTQILNALAWYALESVAYAKEA